MSVVSAFDPESSHFRGDLLTTFDKNFEDGERATGFLSMIGIKSKFNVRKFNSHTGVYYYEDEIVRAHDVIYNITEFGRVFPSHGSRDNCRLFLGCTGEDLNFWNSSEIKGQGPLKSDAPWSANSISCASPAPASDHICSFLTYVDCAAEFLVLIETCSAAAASFVRVVRHSVAAADLLNRLKIWFQRRYAFELDHPRKRLRWIYF